MHNQVGLALQLSILLLKEIRPLFGHMVWANNWPKPYDQKAVEYNMIRLKMIKNILFNFQQTYYFLNVSTSIDVFFKSTIRVQCLLKSSSTMISPETKNKKVQRSLWKYILISQEMASACICLNRNIFLTSLLNSFQQGFVAIPFSRFMIFEWFSDGSRALM